MLEYLTKCKQRIEIGSAFSSWYGISAGVPEDSIIRPLFSVNLSIIYSFVFQNL